MTRTPGTRERDDGWGEEMVAHLAELDLVLTVAPILLRFRETETIPWQDDSHDEGHGSTLSNCRTTPGGNMTG